MKNKKVFGIFLSILLGFLTGAVFLSAMGLSAGKAYGRLFQSLIGVRRISYVIVTAVPYIVTGLSVAFSFRTGVFNIGAEGQFVAGTLAALLTGIFLPELPKGILIPLCFAAALLFGALWGAVVGWMKIRFGINEVLSMIMFNWIAFYLCNFITGLPGVKSEGSAEATRNLPDAARLLFSKDLIRRAGLCPKANWGILVAVLLAVLSWFVLEKTDLGFRLRAVGQNKNAAEYAGISVGKSVMVSLAVSGALAGLAGALYVMGTAGRIPVFAMQEGYGFAGIVVALIGCSNPFGILAAGLFYGMLVYGGTRLNLVGAPTQLVNVIIGTIVFFISIAVIFERIRLKKAAKEGTANG